MWKYFCLRETGMVLFVAFHSQEATRLPSSKMDGNSHMGFYSAMSLNVIE